MTKPALMTIKELDALRHQLDVMHEAVKRHCQYLEDNGSSLSDLHALHWAESLRDALVDAVDASRSA